MTFWYVWLFDHAAGSALITLLAHATEGSVNVDGLYPEGSSAATRTVLTNLVLWCVVAVILLLADRRFWTVPATSDVRPARFAKSD